MIQTEDQLKNHFHDIHNYIRDEFGLYGKSALNFFNYFFVLKIIEPHLKTLKLTDKCKYSNILERSKHNENELINIIINEINDEISLKKFKKNEHIDENEYNDNKDEELSGDDIDKRCSLKDTIMTEFPIDRFKAKECNLRKFIEMIDKITPEVMDKFHVRGRVYEYFLGFITSKNGGNKKGSQIEDLGQYFSNRNIIRYIISKVNPELENNEVPLMADYFCGSGGFLTEYVRFLNHKYDNIDWNKNLKKVIGFDTDREITKSAKVDLLSITNAFKMIDYLNIIDVSSSFLDDPEVKVKFNFTNPPYGGGSKNKKDMFDMCQEIKDVAKYGCSYKNELDQEQLKESKKKTNDGFLINKTDKESLSLLHGMGIIEKDGVYAGILKEGLFFDKKYKSLRKELINNYQVEWVISVPQDNFWNTTTKTSILIFRNNHKKTDKIKFCSLSEIKNKKGEFIGINEISIDDKIINEFNCLNYQFTKKESSYLEASYNDIVKNEFSLNYKNYIKNDIKASNGFKIVKLGDIIEYKKKSSRKASYADENGIFRFYTSSETIKKCHELDYKNKLSIIMGTGGKGSLFLDDNFSCSADNFIITTTNDNLTIYIYYYLRCNWTRFIKLMFNGSTLGHINKENLNKYEIQIPDNLQDEILEKIINKHNDILDLQIKIKNMEKEQMNNFNKWIN